MRVLVRAHSRQQIQFFVSFRYEKNLLAYSDAAWKSEASLLLLDGVQALLLNGGLLLGLLLAAKNIVDGTNSLGNIILVNSYLLQVCSRISVLTSASNLPFEIHLAAPAFEWHL